MIDEVRKIAAVNRPLSLDTEIYKQLRISGDDLWELLLALRKRLGTNFEDMDLRRFAPGEADWGWPWPFPQRRYASLTIGDLIEAAERGRWSRSE